jgi:hypothetical protein
MTENKKLTFTTVGGLVLEYEPISPTAIEMSERGTRKKYKDAGEPIEPPTYESDLAGGGKQVFEYDETSVKGHPEIEAIWAKHIDALKRLNTEIAEIKAQLILSAVKVELPADGSWIRRQKRLNIEVPEKPADNADVEATEIYQEKLRIHYLMTEILKTVEDNYGIVERIYLVSLQGAMTEEQIEAARASFRRTLPEVKLELGVN